jgi:putative membrane protein
VNLDGRSVPYRVLENASRLAFVALFGVVSSTSSGGSFDPASLLVIVVLGTTAIVGWELAYVRRYTYELTEETFDIESGVLSRREREIPYERVQNVDISQNVVQRALDIAEVRLETAGGSGTEAALKYVSRAEADRLQEALSRRKRPSADETGATTEDETLFVLSGRELGVLGLVSADLRLLGLATIGLSAFAPTLARQLTPTVDLVSLAGPWLALVGLAGLWVVSAVAAMSRYWSFRLARGDEELRYERGLLQRYNGTIPLSKVQTLRLRENVLARALGYANLVVETAGYGPGDDGGAQSAVPLAERDRALALARTLEPVGDLSFTRPPKRARTRYVVRYGLAVGALVAALWTIDAVTGALGPWYLAAGLFVLVPPAAHLTWVNRGYDVDENYVVTRSGFWRRETVVVPYDRVQTVENSQTVFQRRRSLGTLVVDTASSGGMFGTEAAAIDIDAGEAESLREAVVERFQAQLRGRAVAHPGD